MLKTHINNIMIERLKDLISKNYTDKQVKEKNDILLRSRKEGERVYLSKHSWDCGWYWGFGYVGNRDCHFHLSNAATRKRA